MRRIALRHPWKISSSPSTHPRIVSPPTTILPISHYHHHTSPHLFHHNNHNNNNNSSNSNSSNSSSSKLNSTIDESEVEFFSTLARAKEWWNPTGKLKTLHQINPFRIKFIKNKLIQHQPRQQRQQKIFFGENNNNDVLQPLRGLHILDVGCGGGLASESLARLGATVMGIDASFNNVQMALEHREYALRDVSPDVYHRLQYRHCTAEQLLYEMVNTTSTLTHVHDNKNGENKGSVGWFDAIVSLEVVEHVSDLDSFTHSLSALLKPGGSLFMSTLNRTPKSFVLAIAAAEYLLQLVPPGTHDWQKFLKPEELVLLLESNGLAVQEMVGVDYSPMTEKFKLTDDLSVNYQLYATKPTDVNKHQSQE